MKNKVIYEARLNRNINRTSYGKRIVYKKGSVIFDCNEKQFNKITADNIHMQTSLGICEGHGIYEYFDLEKDIEFVRVESKIVKKEKIVKLNTT